MTDLESAQYDLYQLYNVAEHVDRLTQIAQVEIERDPAEALSMLRLAKESASKLEFRLDDAIKSVEKYSASR